VVRTEQAISFKGTLNVVSRPVGASKRLRHGWVFTRLMSDDISPVTTHLASRVVARANERNTKDVRCSRSDR
jgi:hypothetical protein